jgi:glycosyltransferase involved in cell wall biosynthesis
MTSVTPTLLVLCNALANDGGTESYWNRILPALIGTGIRVVVAARTVTGHADCETTVIRWGGEDEPGVPAAALAVRRLIAEVRPDAVIISNVFDQGVVAAARSAPRMVTRVHDHRLFCPNGNRLYPQFSGVCSQSMGIACAVGAAVRGCVRGPRPESIARLRARQELKEHVLASDAFIVSSSFMARTCERNGVDPARIVVAAPPCEARSLAAPVAPRPPVSRVLFVGRIVPEKGLVSLVRALAHLPAGRRPMLEAAGEPTNDAHLAAKTAERLGVPFVLLGRRDGDDLEAAYDRASVVAVPSLWPEPFGLVGIEAHAHGRPVVAYDVGGVREWLGEGGIAVPRGDERALARALAEVLEPERWSELSSTARLQAQRFTAGAHIAQLLSASSLPARYQQLIP